MYKTQDTVLKSTTDMTVHTKQTLVTDRIVYATKNYRCDSLQNNVLVQTIPLTMSMYKHQEYKLGRYTSIIALE